MDFSFWIVVVILVLVVIWFICREFFCWYWKINERRDILSAIHDDLSVLYDMQKSLSQLKDICFSLDSLKIVLMNQNRGVKKRLKRLICLIVRRIPKNIQTNLHQTLRLKKSFLL